jgi:hypothetical protein
MHLFPEPHSPQLTIPLPHRLQISSHALMELQSLVVRGMHPSADEKTIGVSITRSILLFDEMLEVFTL